MCSYQPIKRLLEPLLKLSRRHSSNRVHVIVAIAIGPHAHDILPKIVRVTIRYRIHLRWCSCCTLVKTNLTHIKVAPGASSRCLSEQNACSAKITAHIARTSICVSAAVWTWFGVWQDGDKFPDLKLLSEISSFRRISDKQIGELTSWV